MTNEEEKSESFFQMKYLSDVGLFELAWFDKPDDEDGESRKYFSVRLLPETFQQMSADMLRMVKDFNLMQALEYEERVNGDGSRGESGECSTQCGSSELANGEAESQPVEGSPQESTEDNARAAGETEGIVQEV